ncbi:MAG TPA: OmpA family protein [Bacteroidales bacterium]|nr:OmpA family protein [Bacteroidales bacterium]
MKRFTLILLSFILITAFQESYAQINIGKKIEGKIKNRVNSKVDKGIDKGLDNVEKDIKGDGQKPKEDPAKNDKENPEVKPDAAKADKNADKGTSLVANSKYDFVPGDKVILYEDFSQDAVGDFPALWTTDVAGEINTLNIAPGNWFNLNSTEGTYWFMNEIDFPKNFILEFDIVPKAAAPRIAADIVLFGETKHSEMDKNGDPGNCGLHITIEKNIWETKGYKTGVQEKLTGSSTNYLVEAEKVNHVIVWVQNRRVRIYHKNAKVIDVPTNIYEGSKFSRMCFKLYRGASCGSYISNIKITNAAPDTRNKLLEEGKLVTYGIYFDVNKDVVKAESYGTLSDIAKILNEVPDVKVKIVGHTDSDGQDEANLDLSRRRAANVKAELAKLFNVDPGRLSTDGMGESQPVAPNNSPSNKAMNRRVEFLKL